MTPSRDIPYLLINTPLTDPTAPYHSISYLIGAAAAAGYRDFTVLDASLEALELMVEPAQVAAVLERCRYVRAELERAPRLSRGQSLLYRYALKAVGLGPETPGRAVEVLRDPARFYDYRLYQEAVHVLQRWMDVLSACGLPGQFKGFGLDPHNVLDFGSVTDLIDVALLEELIEPFRPYFEGPFQEAITARPFELIGLSVNYMSQLPFAVWMCREIRALCPSVTLCVGGTEVTEDVKNLRDKHEIWALFPDCDAIVVGEGETALVELLHAAAARRPAPCGRPGIMSRRDPRQGSVEVRFEDLGRMAAPRYDIWPWARYWSPEPVILYSPTRGCYWNKCAFCDYGLNTDMPTSPSRARPILSVMADLEAARKIGRTVYFAVDAMSPSYLRRLCEALIDHKLGIRWSAELRLENTFLEWKMGSLLRAAGCVAMSFGYESGAQRVLDRIDKGVRIDRVPEVLGELAAADIGLQLMGFIGFPGEREDEALETYRFLLQHAALWTLCGIGDFMLTPGAIAARQPARFGIREHGAYAGDDIVRALWWIGPDGCVRGSGSARTARVRELARLVQSPFADRPFVGGIDSSHTLLYFARNGRRMIPAEVAPPALDGTLVATARYMSPLPESAFAFDIGDLHDCHAAVRARRRALRATDVLQWLAGFHEPEERRVPALDSLRRFRAGATIDVYHSGDLVVVDADEAACEESAGDAYWAVKALLLRNAGAI
jgi:anaerobic magnesium-protoporphyrin IX monomethyl ester cyclase